MVQLVVAPDFWVNRIYPEGLLEQWLVADDAHVCAGQAIAQLRIEGEVIELKAPVGGNLKIAFHKNSPIEPGAVIGHIA